MDGIEYNKHIPSDFARIYEEPFIDGVFDRRTYYILRDDFYQNHKSFLSNGQETQSELEALFNRKPKVSNEEWFRFACANAKYYCRILGIQTPYWVNEYKHPGYLMPTSSFADCIENDYHQTPPEFIECGFIYKEKNLKTI